MVAMTINFMYTRYTMFATDAVMSSKIYPQECKTVVAITVVTNYHYVIRKTTAKETTTMEIVIRIINTVRSFIGVLIPPHYNLNKHSEYI